MTAVKGYCKHVSMNCPAPTPAPTPKPTGTPTSAPTSTPTPKPTPSVLKNTCRPMGNGYTCWQPGAHLSEHTYAQAYCKGHRCTNSRSIAKQIFAKSSGGTNPMKEALHSHPACRGVTGDRSGSNLNFLNAADRPLCCALICSQSHICRGVDTTDFRSDKCSGAWTGADKGCVFLTGSYETGGCGVRPMAQDKPLQRNVSRGGRHKYLDGSFGKSKWIKQYNGKGIMNSEKGQCDGKVPGCSWKLDWISGLLQCNGDKPFDTK